MICQQLGSFQRYLPPLAGHKPEGLRKRWVFHLDLRSPLMSLMSLACLFVSKKLRCRVEWMKKKLYEVHVVFIHELFWIQDLMSQFQWNCVTTDLDFEDKFDVVFKIDDFSNQFLGKKKDLLFNGKLWIHRFAKNRCQKEVRSGAS